MGLDLMLTDCPTRSDFNSISASASILVGDARILNFSVPRGRPPKEIAKLPSSFRSIGVELAAGLCPARQAAPSPSKRATAVIAETTDPLAINLPPHNLECL